MAALARTFPSNAVHAKKMRPIIICGMPRSGTRMVANLLQTSPNIALTNEYSIPLIRSALAHLDAMDRLVRPRFFDHRRRRQYWFDNWLLASSASVRRKAAAGARIGNKTPSAEFFFERYDQTFAPTEPLYIYCMRPPLSVLTSLANMSWTTRSVWHNWCLYKLSVRMLAQMVESAPGRVLLVRVDRLLDPDDYVELTRAMHHFVDEPFSRAQADQVAGFRPAQPSAEVLQGRARKELTASDEARVRRDPFHRRVEELLDETLSPQQAVLGMQQTWDEKTALWRLRLDGLGTVIDRWAAPIRKA